MRSRPSLGPIASLVALIAGLPVGATGVRTDIPRLDGIEIDGRAADWQGRGFRVAVMKTFTGAERPSEFDPSFRLGWSGDGLLLLAEVRDCGVTESEADDGLSDRSSVEVWLAGPARESGLYYTVVSTGADPRFPRTRVHHTDERPSRPGLQPVSVRAASRKAPDGYAAEILFPWANLGVEAARGMDLGIMVVVNGFDARLGQLTRAFWNPPWQSAVTGAMGGLRLAEVGSPSILALATPSFEHYRHLRVDLRASPELAGRTLSLRWGAETLAGGEVSIRADGTARARLLAPLPAPGTPMDALAVWDGEVQVAPVRIARDRDLLIGQALRDANLRFDPYVFGGTEFPGCDFEHPLVAEEAIGPYTTEATFYDEGYRKVASADQPGRYGAVVEITPLHGGRTLRRFRTLYRQSEPIRWWACAMDIRTAFPAQMGIDPAVASESSGRIAEHMKWAFVESLGRDPGAGAFFAGLHESRPGAPVDALRADRQWWVGLKRRLYGSDQLYPQPFVCPRPLEGPPAPVLREGTPVEAGMKTDATARIDSLLAAWAADTDEAFAALVARHGVIVLHKAYGMRDGKPMTVDTRSWMASNTKLMSANLMWMLVDQGLVNLDDPADRYLPALQGLRHGAPVTVRSLYNHTWGFTEDEHWGDEMNDLEEVISGYYPYLKVGQAQYYNGVGYALGGKIIEAISGESIPAFFRKHLLDPLGCTGTEVTDTMGGAGSIPMDMARIAQLILNGGAYGSMRFYRPETLERMLPVDLDAMVPTDAPTKTPDRRWGIGLMSYRNEGLGPGTIGHGAASGATLRIDPANDLVIVMARNSIGRNYWKYHAQFLRTVGECVEGRN